MEPEASSTDALLARVTTLPKWARVLVKRLQREVAAAGDLVKQLRGSPGLSRTAYLVQYDGDMRGRHYVPLYGDKVRFKVSPAHDVEVHVVDGLLYINSGSGLLSVHPQCANAIKVTIG